MALLDDVKLRLQMDTARLSDAALGGFIVSALRHLSDDLPREATAALVGNGTRIYSLLSQGAVVSQVTGWSRGVSHVREVFYPIDAASGYAETYDASRWTVRQELFTGGLWLPALVLADALGASESFRITFTAAWAEGDADLAGARYEAVADKAAELSHRALAAVFARRTDATLVADAVDEGTRVRYHQDLADDYARKYSELIGALSASGNEVVSSVRAASITHPMPTTPKFGARYMRGYRW